MDGQNNQVTENADNKTATNIMQNAIVFHLEYTLSMYVILFISSRSVKNLPTIFCLMILCSAIAAKEETNHVLSYKMNLIYELLQSCAAQQQYNVDKIAKWNEFFE